MGGGKGGNEPQALYKPRHTGALEDMAFNMLMGTVSPQSGQSFAPQGGAQPAPFGGLKGNHSPGGPFATPAKVFSGPSQQHGSTGLNIPKFNTGQMSQAITSGTMLNGQKIPTYNPGSNYNFKAMDISGAPEKAYSYATDRGLEGIQKAQKMFGAQANNQMQSRGLGNSGFARGQQMTLARNAQEQASNMYRDIYSQRAREQVELDKYRAGLDAHMQNAQADENFRRTQQSLAAQQALQGMQLQQIGALGSLHNQEVQDAMRPWQMITQLYGQNLGAPFSPGEGGKGDPFSALLNAGGMAAGAYFGGPVGAQAGSRAADMATHFIGL